MNIDILNGAIKEPILHKVNIRHALERDLLSLEWDGEYSHFRLLYRDVFNRSILGDTIMWLAELEGWDIIGHLFVQLHSSNKEYADGIERAYLFSFRVRSKFRNVGIGKFLLNTAENDLRKRGYSYSVLNVSKANEDALDFYIKCGYFVVSEEPGNWAFKDQFGKLQVVNEPSWRMEKQIMLSH